MLRKRFISRVGPGVAAAEEEAQAVVEAFTIHMLPRRRRCPRNLPGFPDPDTRWRGASGLSTISTVWREWQRHQAFPRLIATWGWVTTSGLTNKARSLISKLALLWRWANHLSRCRPRRWSETCPRARPFRPGVFCVLGKRAAYVHRN
jgi:hypothetical protein